MMVVQATVHAGAPRGCPENDPTRTPSLMDQPLQQLLIPRFLRQAATRLRSADAAFSVGRLLLSRFGGGLLAILPYVPESGRG